MAMAVAVAVAVAVAASNAKGQVVIPVEIRTRHELTPGTQIEFVDGYGMILVPPAARNTASPRLSTFDAAPLVNRPKVSA